MSLLRRYRRWRCRRQFSRLSAADQRIMHFLGCDPDSLIERGEL